MLEAITTGQDLHRLTAAAVFTKAPEDVTKEERAFGKTVNFGTLYGQGLRGLIEAAHKQGLALSEAEARQIQQRFATAWPELSAWRQRQMRDTAPVIQMPSGRIRRLDPDAPGTVRANTPIQGLAADGFKAALAELWATRASLPLSRPHPRRARRTGHRVRCGGCRRRRGLGGGVSPDRDDALSHAGAGAGRGHGGAGLERDTACLTPVNVLLYPTTSSNGRCSIDGWASLYRL